MERHHRVTCGTRTETSSAQVIATMLLSLPSWKRDGWKRRREDVFTVQLPPERVLQQEARILNRTLRWTLEGIASEAHHWHVEVLMEESEILSETTLRVGRAGRPRTK